MIGFEKKYWIWIFNTLICTTKVIQTTPTSSTGQKVMFFHQASGGHGRVPGGEASHGQGGEGHSAEISRGRGQALIGQQPRGEDKLSSINYFMLVS